ncbi:MAG TPA: patatin-like phospholipase family protein [Caulobacterales bacterium]|nr:patatin-like phospholipase family protein [Caulobacterales bacterium]
MQASGSQALHARLFGAGPKRILSIDGGGVRGILAAGILSEVERRLKRRSGKADFRLCDYFDLIGGTSTGSIIAAALAMGRSVEEITQLYRELAPEVFSAQGANAGIRKPRFDANRLDEVLARELGDHELGSPALKTGFAVFTKRVDTGSAWTLTNNPRSAFWEGPEHGFPNKRFQIRKLVLASAAAPSFFEERRIALIPDGETAAPGVDAEGEFVDGGVAALNDPSLQLLKVATLAPYGFNWHTGDDRLLMLSVGTGYWRPALRYDPRERDLFATLAPEAARAVFALKSMIHDASLNTLVTMQSLSEPAKPWRINSEIGEMRGARLSPVPVLHFQRLDVRLDEPEEIARLGLRYDEADLEAMKDMAAGDGATLARLHEIGRSAGEDYFRRRKGEPSWEQLMLPARFDPSWFDGPPEGPPRSRLEAMGRVFAKR